MKVIGRNVREFVELTPSPTIPSSPGGAEKGIISRRQMINAKKGKKR